jgi:hypothetical protein
MTHAERVEARLIKIAERRNNIQNFHVEMDQTAQCSFNTFLKAALSLFPYAEVEVEDNQLIIYTNLEYVEGKDGTLIVKPKDV